MTKAISDKPLPPQEIVSRPDAEASGKEGTLGGNPPLKARAGIQSIKAGGVLDVVHDGAAPADAARDDTASATSEK